MPRLSGLVAVKAVGGARPCDAVRTCTHQERDSAMAEDIDASEMRVFRPKYGHNRACHCEKRAVTEYGQAGPKPRHKHAYEHQNGRQGVDRTNPPSELSQGVIPAFLKPGVAGFPADPGLLEDSAERSGRGLTSPKKGCPAQTEFPRAVPALPAW